MSTETDSQPLGLKRKLLLIRRGLKTLPKKGWNAHHEYHYARAEDAVAKAQRLLDKHEVLLKPAVDPTRELRLQGSVTYVPMTYTFEDVETGQEEVIPWLGAGADKQDKGLYKGFTGSTKYFLIQFFQMKVGQEDPEATDENGLSTRQAQAATTVDKDADRPGAPRIPRDRAKLIADAAVAAGIASWSNSGTKKGLEMEPVLKAQLSLLGVELIGELNVDQAETLEAFIAEEAKG